MNNESKEAIILAGGRGERLRPLTFDRPKPMIEVFDFPLLHYSLRWLKECGFKRVIISCNYKHEVISQHFGNGDEIGIEIVYAVEDMPLGRGGGIKLASKRLTNTKAPVLVLNGDVITRLVFSDLIASHLSSGADITLVTVPLHSPYGIVEISDDNRAVDFREKPTLPYWINAGIYVVNNEIFTSFPDHGDHEETLFPSLAKQGNLYAYKFQGFWRTVDTIKDLEELKQDKSMLAHWT